MTNRPLKTGPSKEIPEGLPPRKVTRGLLRFREKEASPERGGELWLYTLSDLLLLLVIFFVLLFGMSLSKQEKKNSSLQASVAVAEVREEAPVQILPDRVEAPEKSSSEVTAALE